MKLSVIIPALDAAATIGDQLEALAGQSWPGGWEVVVADNGSTDRTLEVVESFRGRLPALAVVDASARRGQAYARNQAAQAATGDALVMADADDVVGEGWLEAIGRALERHDFVACRFDMERLNPAWIQRVHHNPQRDGLIPYGNPPFLPHAGGGGLGIKRRLFLEMGGFDETLPPLEDTDLCWRVQLAGTPLVFVPEAVAHIRWPQNLKGLYRQGYRWGERNIEVYRKYRAHGMPRLGPWSGLAKWATLLLRAPALATRSGRGRWMWALGWRTGRLRGCLRYRVAAL